MVKPHIINYLACSTCGSNIPIPATLPKRISCPNCGQPYEREGGGSPNGSPRGGFWEFLGGVFIGAVFLGPFIWTPLGRATAVEAIRRGAGVTRKKVEEWLKKGEVERAG